MMKLRIFLAAAAVFLCAACSAPEMMPRSAAPVTALPATEPPASPPASPTPAPEPDYDSLSDKVIGWGIKKNSGAAPDIPDSVKAAAAKYDAYYADTSGAKTLYLTFDEGYENGYTASILDTLKSEGVPAAFFVTEPYLKKETALVRRMIDEGHTVGNHTAHHPNLAKLTPEKAKADIEELAALYKEMYGGDMRYLRPPEGAYSERVLALARSMGYKTVFWSFAYKDWDPDAQRGAAYAFDSVTRYLHDGAIVLLHAVSKDNAEALGDIIRWAKQQGYEFKGLDELCL